MRRLLPIIYLIVGAVVANQHHYYAHLHSLSQIVSAVLATALWPLVLLGTNLHVSISSK